jgi:hypothetical protein
MHEQTPTVTKARKREQPSVVKTRTPVDARARELATSLSHFDVRMQQLLTTDDTLNDVRCTDSRLTSTSGISADMIAELSHDARAERKELIPLRVIEALSSSELSRIRQRLTQALRSVDAEQFSPPGVVEQAESELAAAEKKDFALVYQLKYYREPRLIYSLEKNKRLWIPGTLHALVAVHDLKTGARLCQTPVRVENDTREAPTRSRLRSEVRDRFISELVATMKTRSTQALRQVGVNLQPSARTAHLD